jgi:hypothetical protein
VDGEPAIRIGSDPGDPSYRTLEVEWREQGVPMRLYLYLAADDTHWWVTEMRTSDGSSGGGSITYRGDRFRTPLGGTFSGSYAGTGVGDRGDGTLRIDGLRLTAFAAGTGPGPLTGCRPWALVPGGPVMDLDSLVGMPPDQAAARLRQRGVCHEFRWSYSTGPSTGYAERWCVPPPSGVVTEAGTLDGGVVLLQVSDDSGIVREPREQPPQGWGCPTDQRAAASPDPGGQPPMTGGTPPAPSSPDPAGDRPSVPNTFRVAASPAP